MGSYGKLIDGIEVIEKVHNDKSPWRNIVPVRLNNCPVCGAEQVNRKVACTYFGFCVGADGWAAYCRECNASTSFCHTQEEAVNKWNKGDIQR